MQRFATYAFFAAAAVAAVVWIFAPAPVSTGAPGAEGVATFATWNMEWFPSGWPEPRPEGDAPRLAVCSDFWFSPTNRSLQQVAVFSRFPVLAAGSESWVASDFVFPPRGFAWAILDVRGEKVAVFDVHLKSNYVPEGKDEARAAVMNRLKRELAARQLVSRAAAIAATNGWNVGRLLVAGDFNTAAEDPRFAGEKTMRIVRDAGFRDAFEGVPEAERPTLPASDLYPAATFDHICAKGFGAPFSRRVAAVARTSDHAPVYAAWIVPEPERTDTP